MTVIGDGTPVPPGSAPRSWRERARGALSAHGVPAAGGGLAGLGAYAGLAAQMSGPQSAAKVCLSVFSSLVAAGSVYGGLLSRRRPARTPPPHRPDATVRLLVDCAPYDHMWVTWIKEALAPGVHIDPDPEHGGPRDDGQEPEPLPWRLVVVSAARAEQPDGDPARTVWQADDAYLRGRHTVVLCVGGPVPDVRAEHCLVELVRGDAPHAPETLERTLRRLGALPDTVRTAAAPGAVRFPADGPTHCRLPPADPAFAGRSDILAAMRRRLVTAPDPSSPRGVCLWGLGGVGKTSLALEYAHRFQQYYETVWWVRAETEADLRGDLVDLGSRLGVPADPDMSVMLRDLQVRLAEAPDILLILDNAEPEEWLTALWPRGNGLHLIVTSRQPDWTALLGPDHRIEILPAGLSDAADLLLQASERGASPQELGAARAIAADLGCLPLALAHAAAYVRQSGITLPQFHELLRSSRKRLLNEYRPNPSSLPVTLTWSLSLRRSDEEAPGTAALMRLCAMLAPDEIPRRLLRDHADAAGGVLGSVLSDPVTFDACVRSLVKYSLVKAVPDSLRLHRLVQDAVLSESTPADVVRWLDSAASIVLAAFPEDVDDLEQWPDCDRMTAHAQAVVTRFGQLAADLPDSTSLRALTADVAAVALRCGEYQLERGNFGTADSLLSKAVRLFHRVSGDAGTQYLIASARSALASYRLADLPAARRKAEAAVEACTDVTDPAAQVLALHILARVLIEFSELDTAYRHAERAHRTLSAAPAGTPMPAGEERSAVERTLAVIQWRRGDFLSAVRWIRGADAHRDERGARVPGFEPIELALAELTGDRAHIRAIGERAERSIAELEPVLGAGHRDLIGRRNVAGEAAALLGDHEKARSMFEASLEGLLRSHGREHPSTAWAERSLGGVLCRQGAQEQGLGLLRHALTVYEGCYGETHPYAAEALTALGSAEAACGLPEPAERHLREAWRIVELTYGPDHPKLVFIFDDLSALLLARDPASAEAEGLSARAAAIRERATSPS